jgi:hypothetical protein
MNTHPTAMERAFELARSGQCLTVQDIRRRLSAEGYLDVRHHLAGRSIMAELGRLIKAALAAKAVSAEP